jgi:hypothetical protein
MSTEEPVCTCCWEDEGRSTCLLPDGHDGPHEFTPDTEIVVRFAVSSVVYGYFSPAVLLIE